jgi:hypothetical protein
MRVPSNTYHYVGPLNARRPSAPRLTQSGNQLQCDFQTSFASTTGFESTTILASAVARGMRQHGHFGLA